MWNTQYFTEYLAHKFSSVIISSVRLKLLLHFPISVCYTQYVSPLHDENQHFVSASHHKLTSEASFQHFMWHTDPNSWYIRPLQAECTHVKSHRFISVKYRPKVINPSFTDSLRELSLFILPLYDCWISSDNVFPVVSKHTMTWKSVKGDFSCGYTKYAAT